MSRGSTVTTIEDIRFPTPDEIEGFWAFDKMHAGEVIRSVIVY